MPTLMIDGQRLSYRESGSERPGLLLLHGAGCSSLGFLELMRQLSSWRRVVALDLPGHGNSPPLAELCPADQLIPRYSALAADFAEKLGLGRFVALGHSMGGAVALELALAFPERLEGLVLVTTSARLKIAEEFLVVVRHQFAALPGFLAALGFSPTTAPERAAKLAREQIQASSEIYWADLKACATFDRRAQLAQIRCPALVISAADDRLTPPRLQQQLAESLPAGRLASVDRAGHFVFAERPDAVAGLIRER